MLDKRIKRPKDARPLTNCEIIYRDRPDNVLIVNIPHTEYSLLCERLGKDNWDIWMVELDGTNKELVRKGLTSSQFGGLIDLILAQKP